jgi:hypothetical protein
MMNQKNIFDKIIKMKQHLCLLVVLFFCASGSLLGRGIHENVVSDEVLISNKGKALLKVEISPKASKEIKFAASELVRILDTMGGAKFETVTGNGKQGIAIGTINDFPELPFKPEFDLKNPGQRQGYEIKTHKNGIYIIGVTPQSTQYGVFDFLSRLGYRRYFPMKKWEIIPRKQSLSFNHHIKETPDYYYRKIWPYYRAWPEYQKSLYEWGIANRDGGYSLKTHHSYTHFVRTHKDIFDKHPEYYGLYNGKRMSTKMCISNPALRKLYIDYSLAKFEKNPEATSISAEPSDGGCWCECKNCVAMGGPSTRAVFLANELAKAVRAKYPNKKIGLYAYNYHSSPPEIDVDQDVVVNIATAFIKSGKKVDDIIKGWQKKKAAIGIREYYSIYHWSKDAPGAAAGGDFEYLKRTIRTFYNYGARYLSSESSDGWGPNGLGYYLALKMLWNIDEDKNFEKYKQEFYRNCFGKAAATMQKYYDILDAKNRTPLSADKLGRMYRFLKQARAQAKNSPEVLARINDLVLYTKYCEYLLAFNRAGKNVKSYLDLGNFAAKTRYCRMVHTRPIYRKQLLRHVSRTEKLYKKAELDWKTIKHYKDNELSEIINQGIANNPLVDFDQKEFSENLIPAPKINRMPVKPGRLLPRRGKIEYYAWVDNRLTPFILKVMGGLIANYRDRGNVRVKLIQLGGSSETGSLETLIMQDKTTPPDGKEYTIKLTPREPGLHKIVINDGRDRTLVSWDKKYAISIPVAQYLKGSCGIISGTFYFYVPKGTKVVGFYNQLQKGQMVDAGGKVLFKFNSKLNGFNSVKVSAGQDGKLWKLNNIDGRLQLLNVPPYLALSASALLIPQEVVAADKLR